MGLVGVSSVSLGDLWLANFSDPGLKIDQVEIGHTGLKTSRLALGCGQGSWARQSTFTRAGLEQFLKVAQYAHERGITFLDTADLYGTHPFVGELFKLVPRDRFQLMTKIWTEDNDWYKVEPVNSTLNRFSREMRTDYFDIVLLHCMVDGNWISDKKVLMDQLSEAKQKKRVKNVGVSCHNIDALRVAASDPWVDVILARINPLQLHMDGTPDEIMQILKTAKANGKGVIGMKIYGDGTMKTDQERQSSLKFAIESEHLDAITIGMEKTEYIDYAVDRICKLVKG